MSRTRAAALLALALALIATIWWWRFTRPIRWETDRPHVVLVIGCTVRADQTSLHDPTLGTTPFLAEVAARGVRFLDPVAAAPWTKASAGALLTGVHAARLGLADPGPGRNDRALPPEATTLAETLHEAGWVTVGVTANPNLDPTFGFDQGFDAYTALAPRWHEKVIEDKVHGTAVVAEALRLAHRRADPKAPLYVQAVLVDAHRPYDAPERDVAAFRQEGIPEPVAAYRAGLRGLDDDLRALARGLSYLGITEDNAIFVFTSDHGEGLEWPPHHGRGHGRYPYPSVVEATWAMAGVGVARGHEVRGVASGVDLLPTLLGLLNLPVPDVDGHDLSAAARGEAEVTGRDVAFTDTRFMDVDRAGIYSDTWACLHDYDPAGARARESQERWPRFRPGCYDRRHDPDFRSPGIQLKLQERLHTWRADVDGTGAVSPVAPLSDEVRRHLEALGYIDE